MSAFDRYCNELITQSTNEFADFPVKWISRNLAEEHEEERAGMIAGIGGSLQWSFEGTKPWVNSLSPGCQLCGEGLWSCLFITGKCNASCFYCPTPQTQDHLPTTQQFEFDNPRDYASYLNRFGFKGCSFSGGEPLLVYDRLKEYLTEVRRSCRPDLYIWMYTNGILGTEERFRELTDLGIDEVRFDIGATQFKLDHMLKASKIVKNLTVEIPAVPEKEKQLLELLPRMIDAGVNNLNLHSMRLTKHNANQVLKRDYTLLHGEQPVVLESELLAFKIIKYVNDEKLPIGVNYCSSQFKRRFQRSGFRKRIGESLSPKEYLSDMGYIFRLEDANQQPYSIHDFIAGKMPLNACRLLIYAYDFLGVKMNEQTPKMSSACSPINFSVDEFPGLHELLSNSSHPIPEDQKLFDVWRFLRIEKGLRSYF